MADKKFTHLPEKQENFAEESKQRFAEYSMFGSIYLVISKLRDGVIEYLFAVRMGNTESIFECLCALKSFYLPLSSMLNKRLMSDLTAEWKDLREETQVFLRRRKIQAVKQPPFDLSDKLDVLYEKIEGYYQTCGLGIKLTEYQQNLLKSYERAIVGD